MSSICKYPVVFIHGVFGWGAEEGINKKLPYWGASTGDLTEYLNAQGYETYAASVGPISSAWDRACELYARLTGTVVDYGKAHSEKAGHRRFGRKYDKPLFENWGSERKVHLVGHSFGGNTARLLVHLLTNGDPTEQAATTDGSISGLFTGGKADWVQSVVSICSPHNGAAAFEAMKKFKILGSTKAVVYNYVGLLGRSRFQGDLVDFHMEQYGLSDTPGKQDAFPLGRARRNLNGNDDSLEFDMSPEGAAEINRYISINPGVFYFSYFYNAVQPTKNGKFGKPSETDFPFLKATSSMILLMSKTSGEPLRDNDGLVDVKSACYPATEPHQDYNADDVRPGIWNVMPERIGDHGTPIGLCADADKTHRMYLDLLDILQKTEQ